MMALSAAIVAGGTLLGGMSANSASAGQASKQRDWQAEMRATSYQTAVEDMRRAGLNPMLAYSQGGSGVPSGSTAQQKDVVGPAVQAGVSAYTAKKQGELIDSQIQTQQTQSALNNALAVKATADADASVASAGETRARTPTYAPTISRTLAEVDKIVQDTKLSFHQMMKVKQEVINAILSGRKIVVDTGNAEVDNELKRLDVRQQDVLTHAAESPLGRYVMPFVPFVNSASNAARK